MAEKSIEEKARKIASQRPEAGKEFEQMQAAQNQLLEIQAAQKQNLMERRVMANSQAEQDQVLAQAAEVGAQSVAAGNMQLNQATQQTMGRYGLSQPKTTSQVKQRQSEVVTRQNVTIHNNTTNITNNTVPANIGGPIQGRPIQFKQPDADGGMGRFKNWLQQTFARQEDAAKKRDREYQRRETALTKSSNKMMRKIEDFSKDLTKKLDPRNVGKTIGGQLKTILGVLGIGLIAKNFNKLLDWIFGAQNKVENEYIPSIKNFFAWVKGDKDAKTPGLITKLTAGIENTFGKLFFGKDYDGSKGNAFRDKGLIKGIRDYLWNEDATGDERGVLNKLFDKIKDGLKERSEMAKNAITLDKSATMWDIIKHPGEAFKEFLNNLTNYFSVLIGGEAAMSKIQGKAVSQRAATYSRAEGRDQRKTDRTRKYSVNGQTIYTDQGDIALFGKNKVKTVPQEYMDLNGQLDGSTGSTIAMSNNLIKIREDAKKGNIKTAAFANAFSELNRVLVSKGSDGTIVISRDSLGISDAELQKLSVWGTHIKPVKASDFHFVLRPRPVSEINAEARSIQRTQELEAALAAWGFGSALLTGGTTAVIGGSLAAVLGLYNECKKYGIHTHTVAIVRANEIKDNDIDLGNISENDAKELLEIDQQGLQAIARPLFLNKDEIAAGKQVSFDMSDKSYVKAGQDYLSSTSRSSKQNYDFDANYMVDYNKDKKAESGHAAAGAVPESTNNSSGNTGTANVTYASNVSEDSGDQAPDNSAPGNERTETGAGLIFGPSGPFDPNAASEWITANASSDCLGGGNGVKGITGWCGRWVRQALVNGGMYGPNLNEHGGPNGGDFKPVLESMGWKEISQNGPFQPGDVMVLQPASRGGGGNYGHVAMFTGKGNGKSGWFSDFDQAGAVSAYSKKLGDQGVSILRYGVGYTGPKTGTPGHFWKKMPNENIFNYSVDTRRGTESPESYIQRNYNARKSKWPKWATAEKLLEYYKKGRNWISNVVRKATGTVASTTSGTATPTTPTAAEEAAVNTSPGGEVTAESNSDSPDRSFTGFFSDAKDIIKNAWGSLSHKASEGAQWALNKAGDAVDWDASLHGGTSYTGGGYPKSSTERYLYAKYTGKDVGNYAIPESIRSGSTLQRDEWWAKFFDKEGNLKIKDSDNVNPTLVKYLHEIEGELKKGNDLDEYHLKIAAQGLDAEMVHNASETRDQQRVISALVSRNSDTAMAQSFTNE